MEYNNKFIVNRIKINALFSLVLFLFLFSCSSKNTYKDYDPTLISQDLVTIPQNLEFFAKKASSNPLISKEEQLEQTKLLKSKHFAPWHTVKPSKYLKKSIEVAYGLNPKNAYIGKSQPFPSELWDALVKSTNISTYPNILKAAITIKNSSLRAMPTLTPFFRNPDLPGEGDPFDYFQHTAVWVGTPLFIVHASIDGQWLLAESSITSGWIPKKDVAFVEEDFIKSWESLPLAAITKDKVELEQGVIAHTGTILALKDNSSSTVLYPQKTPKGMAKTAYKSLSKSVVSKIPVIITPKAVAEIGDNLINQKYGWGGLRELRDCSALIRDLFAPFGIWLPRNSSQQASWGKEIYIGNIPSLEKEKVIKDQAVPFLSLLWLKGHIGLYLGEYNDKPVMFHSIWGLRTKPIKAGQPDGRAVIGRTVITSLSPGVERKDLSTPYGILDRIEKISTLPYDIEAAKAKIVSKKSANKKLRKLKKTKSIKKSKN